jgi:TRAP-type C4-dicarboxylate transport system substrate-binding protein
VQDWGRKSGARIMIDHTGVEVTDYAKSKAFYDAAAKSVAATRKKVNDDEANGIAQLEREGMQVVKKVNSASFNDALKVPYANYAKEFGADKIAAIQAVK